MMVIARPTNLYIERLTNMVSTPGSLAIQKQALILLKDGEKTFYKDGAFGIDKRRNLGKSLNGMRSPGLDG